MTCGIDTEANDLYAKLIAGEDFKIPEINLDDPLFKLPGGENNPLYQTVSRLSIADLTEKTVDGNGAFDSIMTSLKAHLWVELEANRITGAEYTKAYISLNESALTTAAQYLLGREQAYWGALSAQVQAVTSVVQLSTARVELARAQLLAVNQKAEFALTKSKLARESIDYCLSKYQLENLSPLQKEMLTAQVAAQLTESQIAQYNLTNMLPKQLETLIAQLAGIEVQTATGEYTLSTMLPAQMQNLQKQGLLLDEQTEVQRAQTLDSRKDGSTIVGVMGKQKDLYAQQIISYQRDSEIKAARMWSDIWTVNKTVDEGLTVPPVFNNESLQAVFTNIKTKNGLD